jgi:hypothetical protein
MVGLMCPQLGLRVLTVQVGCIYHDTPASSFLTTLDALVSVVLDYVSSLVEDLHLATWRFLLRHPFW